MHNKIFLALLLAPIILISACVGGSAEQICQAKCSLSSSSEYCKCYNSCYADVTGTMSPECKRPGQISTPEPTYSSAQATTTTIQIKISEDEAIKIATADLKSYFAKSGSNIEITKSAARLSTYNNIRVWRIDVTIMSKLSPGSQLAIYTDLTSYVNSDTGELLEVNNPEEKLNDFASISKGAKTVNLQDCSTAQLPLKVGGSCSWGENSIVDDSYSASDKRGYAGCEAGTGTCQITIDLGSVRNLNKIATRLWDNDYRSYYGYSIEVSEDNSSWKKVVDKLTTIVSGHQIDSFSEASARYIRYTGKGNTINQGFHIIEVDAFGK